MNQMNAQDMREAAERFRQIAQEHEDQGSPFLAQRMRKVAADLDAEAAAAAERDGSAKRVN
jgi:hypothetical protein